MNSENIVDIAVAVLFRISLAYLRDMDMIRISKFRHTFFQIWNDIFFRDIQHNLPPKPVRKDSGLTQEPFLI